MKLVPHEFIDYVDKNRDYTYSYSLNTNKKGTTNNNEPSLSIILDYAPVKMILVRKWRDVGNFLIACCSIIGGVFIIFGLLNSFFLKLFGKC